MDMMKQMGCKYSSALLDYAYTENGVRFKERAFCILQDMGTNQWDYRWVDDLGNVLYTDNEDYNPNIDIELQMDGFKRSSVKR
jgi:hypothetical protein